MMRFLCLTIAALLLFLAACRREARPPPPMDHQHAVLAALRLGDLDAAMAALAAAVEQREPALDPVTLHGGFSGLRPVPDGDAVWEISLRQALPLLDQGHHVRGQIALQKGLGEVGAKQADLYLYLALSQLNQSTARNAIGAAIKAVEYDDQCHVCRLTRAVAYDRQGRSDLATADYRSLSDAVVELPIMHYYLALQAQRQADQQAVRQHLDALAMVISQPPEQ